MLFPTLAYDVILGRTFLATTETLSKYRRRITECVFSVANYFEFCLLGDICYRFESSLEDKPVFAVQDTGAERNVMDARYV